MKFLLLHQINTVNIAFFRHVAATCHLS